MARPSKTADGFVLTDDVLSSSEPQHFAGFPGLWQAGVPVAAHDLGVDDVDEAWGTIQELGLPLAKAFDVPRATPDATPDAPADDDEPASGPLVSDEPVADVEVIV